MKIRVIAVASATVLFGIVSAQAEQCFDKATLKYVDCPQPAAPVVVAPVVAPEPISWAGPYLGAQAGYGFGQSDWTYNLDGAFNSAVGETASIDIDGAFAGLHAGYNFQRDRIVFGPEIGGSFSWIEGEESEAVTIPGIPDAGQREREAQIDWFADAGLRLGYLVTDDYLLYAKGGYSIADLEIRQRFSNIVGTTSYEESDIVHGFHLGAGLERRLGAHWRLGVEYAYRHFLEGEFGGASSGPVGSAESIDADASFHSLAARLSYGF